MPCPILSRKISFFACSVLTVILWHHFYYEGLRKIQCFVYVNQFIVRRPPSMDVGRLRLQRWRFKDNSTYIKPHWNELPDYILNTVHCNTQIQLLIKMFIIAYLSDMYSIIKQNQPNMRLSLCRLPEICFILFIKQRSTQWRCNRSMTPPRGRYRFFFHSTIKRRIKKYGFFFKCMLKQSFNTDNICVVLAQIQEWPKVFCSQASNVIHTW